MYPRSFLCEEAKIKQDTPLKEELSKIGEEAIWESRFTSFLLLILFYTKEKLFNADLSQFTLVSPLKCVR